MSIRVLVSSAVVVVSLVWIGIASDSTQTQPNKERLLSACPKFDVAKFSSLQTAFDLLPKDSGIKRIQGSETATHFRSTNTEGNFRADRAATRRRDGRTEWQTVWRSGTRPVQSFPAA